jgi:hypothetical protein
VTQFSRRVEPERLDSLPGGDPAAIQSRRDLQRLNVVMGQPASIARLLKKHQAPRGMRRLVDLGGGDGTLLLRVARQLASHCGTMQGVVVDRQILVSAGTREEFGRLGWGIEVAAADALEWLVRVPLQEGTVMMANLFLHHFREEPLCAMLAQISARTELFVACEPRRSWLTLRASRLVGWIGCNAVTQYDAAISVRAGFAGREISTLWPARDDWDIEEGPIGLFSHFFVACRRRG